VDIDFSEYRKKIDNKTIRRNVALPSWLNYEAEHSGINVSRTLQEALITTLTKEMFSKDNVTILNWIYENRDGLKKISEQFIPRSINGVDLYDLYESDNSVFVMLENVEGYKYKRFNLITHIRLSEDQTRMRLDFNYEGVDFFVKYHDEIIDYIIKKQNRIAKKSNS
jgi:post-segregation antitoxin (ccd killing protein)